MLQQMRHFDVIDEAEDGEKGWHKIDACRDSAYDLVLCDVNMPLLDGIGLLKRCRADQHARYVPFIMVSASSQGEIVAGALGEWGANDFIVKPFSFELLKQRAEMVLRRSNSPEEALFRKAESLKIDGSVDAAMKVIQHWETESRLARAKWLNLKGECQMEMGQLEQASQSFERAIGASNIYIAAYKNYADTNEQQGNVEKAVQALKHIEKLSPTSVERTLKLGKLLLQTGKEEEGRHHLDRLSKRVDPEERGALLKEIAEIYVAGGLFEAAEDTYSLVLKLDPSDLETSNRLGIALRQQGKYEEAEKCYYASLRAHPNHAGIYHNLGILYAMKKEFEKSRKALTRALDIDPHMESASLMLDKVEKKLGK